MKKLITCLAALWLLHAAPAAAEQVGVCARADAQSPYELTYACFERYLISTNRVTPSAMEPAVSMQALGHTRALLYQVKFVHGCDWVYACVTDDEDRLMLLDWRAWSYGQDYRQSITNICVGYYHTFEDESPEKAVLLAKATDNCRDVFSIDDLIVLHDL